MHAHLLHNEKGEEGGDGHEQHEQWPSEGPADAADEAKTDDDPSQVAPGPCRGFSSCCRGSRRQECRAMACRRLERIFEIFEMFEIL